MRLHQLLRKAAFASTICGATLAIAGPALAHEGPHVNGEQPGPRMEAQARDEWLADCRNRLGKSDSVAGGAVIGGIVGGVAGNRIAGKGNRTVGTVAGAAIGAGAGMLVDHAADQGRARDECEAYLDDYEARYRMTGPGYGYYGYSGYGYTYPAQGYGGCCGAPMMMVPIMRLPKGEPECTETIEYVYEDVPAPPARRVVPPKRVKVVPDKRVKAVPAK